MSTPACGQAARPQYSLRESDAGSAPTANRSAESFHTYSGSTALGNFEIGSSHLDATEIEANIEHTRFPVPKDEEYSPTDDFPGLLRAADLIGQLADINYLRRTSALFHEFRETGMSEILKYNSAADLRANYPRFFWEVVRPYIGDALRYLRITQEGQLWIATLYANVFSTEHRGKI